MASTDAPDADKDALPQDEVERLLAQVAEQDNAAALQQDQGAKTSQPRDAIQPYDFRVPVFLSASQLRNLRLHHESYVQALAARLSVHLRLEFGLEMSQFQTLPYERFIGGLGNPCHLTLFKVEPLRGICILDVNPRLGLTIVDRLLGGAGHSTGLNRNLTEIETALLDQAGHLVIAEWCSHWAGVQELHPVLLGHENSGGFLQTSPPEAIIVAVSMEARIGDCVEQMQIGFPYTAIEPLIPSLAVKLQPKAEESTLPTTALPLKWRREFEDVRIPLAARWTGVTMTARSLAALKVGDIIPLPDDFAAKIRVRLVRATRFLGRLGTRDNHWAVELTEVVRS